MRSLVVCVVADTPIHTADEARQREYLAALGDRFLYALNDRNRVVLGFGVGSRDAAKLVHEAPFTLAGIWRDMSVWSSAPFMRDVVSDAAGEMPAIRAVPMPLDQNLGGNVFGGWLLNQIDHAGGLAAWKYARSRCASVSLNATFDDRIDVGDEVSLFTRIAGVGRTSMRVVIDAWARPRMADEQRLVSRAEMTFVALDGHGRPREIR